MNAPPDVLVVDDDPSVREWIELQLRRDGHGVASVGDGSSALREIEARPPEVVILDLMLPDVQGVELLRTIRGRLPALPIVVVTAAESIDLAVDCMRLGAADFVQKPINKLRLVTAVRNAREREALRSRVLASAESTKEASGFAAIVGRSAAITRAVGLLRRVAASDVTVLLMGETGTGKEVAARALHAESPRAGGPFVAVNCGALPETLVESVLFGHERGAFTGANDARPGLFERGHRGTVFLDEVGELPPSMQVKLLRVLQERTVQRIGAAADRRVDVRLIAATNRDLLAEVQAGRMRQDLYYRLAVFPVTMPPLRDREDDVLLLAERQLALLGQTQNRRVEGFSAEARQALRAWRWPGNVRELQNVVERALLLETGNVVRLENLSDEVVCHWFEMRGEAAPDCVSCGERAAPTIQPAPMSVPRVDAGDQAIRTMDEEERRIVERALRLTAWNIQETAAKLGIGRATLYRRMHAWGIARPGDQPPGPEAGTP
jgi:DNA-binding NtrC family response regulator